MAQQLLFTVSLILLGIGSLSASVNTLLSRRNLSNLAQQQAQIIGQGVEFAAEGLLNAQTQDVLERVVQNYASLPGVEEVTVIGPDATVLVTSVLLPDPVTAYDRSTLLQTQVRKAAALGQEQQFWLREQQHPHVVQIVPWQSAQIPTSVQRGVTVVVFDPKKLQQDVVVVVSQVGGVFLGGMALALAGIAGGGLVLGFAALGTTGAGDYPQSSPGVLATLAPPAPQ
ncbi:MAG: hypothetical protein VKK80_06625 [Prochlorothrix sp.]|nr:hypothetical protein [Prochlorothrix sp.]